MGDVWRICSENSQLFSGLGVMILCSWLAGFCLFFGSFLNSIDPISILERVQYIRINTTISTRTITRAVMCALIISVVFCSPALAGNSSLSTGQEMIAGGLDDWIIKKCNDALKADMGVDMGNVSELSGVTPMQRLVFAIATYNQNPYKVSWIREEVKTDYIIYVLSGVVLLIFAGIYFYLQIAFPEFTGQATEMVYGYEKFINYSTFSKTLILLIFLPTFLPFLLKYSIEWNRRFPRES